MIKTNTPRKPLSVEKVRKKVKTLAKDLCAYVDELELHTDPTTNTAYRRRLKVLLGLNGYSGERHAADLRVRHAAIGYGARHVRRWVMAMSRKGYSLYFGTAVMQQGRATINKRMIDLNKIKKKWINFVNRVLRKWFDDVQSTAFIDCVEVRERHCENGETFFDFHIHFLCALKGDEKNIQAVRMSGNEFFKSSTMPQGGFKISQIREQAASTAAKNMAYMLKPPLWHMTTSQRPEGQVQAQKSRKRSLSGILLLLEHLRLIDFNSLLIVSGKHAMEVRKGILRDLKAFHEKRIGKQRPLDNWRGCSRCSRRIMRLAEPFGCKANVCDLKLFAALRTALEKRRKMAQPLPLPAALTTPKEKFAYDVIRHGAIESL